MAPPTLDALRLLSGQPVEKISREEAARIADRIGVRMSENDDGSTGGVSSMFPFMSPAERAAGTRPNESAQSPFSSMLDSAAPGTAI